ncbi:MAG TPA: TIGR02611 family protein [Glaciibacter sp.]|nr:TIGR02611 family protein [Glaciibacter sp.]
MSDDLLRDIDTGSDPRNPIRRFLSRCRAWIEEHPRVRWAYRFGVAVLGLTVALIGLLLVPLPGPGWLIVFLGIAILGTEFPAAHKVGAYIKRMLVRFWQWWRSRRSVA